MSYQFSQQKSHLLSGNKSSALDESQLLDYCRLNKSLMENYWQGFERATAEGNFDDAVRYFQAAFEIGCIKADKLFKEKTDASLQSRPDLSSKPEENFINALRFHLGIGNPQDQAQAVRFYTKAAQQGYASAQFNLGYCYYEGIGVEKDYHQAVQWYQLAAEQGHAAAQNNLGLCYQRGEGIEQDYNEAVRWYRLATQQGNASAQNNLGYCYWNGQGVKQNHKEAVRWFQLAAEQGHVAAQNNLGFCYENSIGVKRDTQKAVHWYRLAAEQGDAEAQNYLGFCYQNGKGVEQDDNEAVRWYRLAAEQEHTGAQNNLGSCYWYGQGVEQNYNEAVRWYRLAVEQGDAAAQNNLGFCYRNGKGVQQDYKEAVRLFELAAEQRNVAGQFNLGFCYQYGKGVEQDSQKAVHWYRLSAEQKDDKALEQLKTLSSSVPLAKYTVYLLEQNYAEAIKLALQEPDIATLFFTKEIVSVAQTLKDTQSVSAFLETLQETTKQSKEDTNKYLISALLALHLATRQELMEENQAVFFLMTELLSSIRLADVASSQIKELMYFFCDIYDEENATEVLNSIKLLWYRAKSLEMPIDDSSLKQIIATKLVKNLLNNAYSISYTGNFSVQDLAILFTAYEQSAKFSVKILNILLNNPLLVTSNTASDNMNEVSNPDEDNSKEPSRPESPSNERNRFFSVPSPTPETADVATAKNTQQNS